MNQPKQQEKLCPKREDGKHTWIVYHEHRPYKFYECLACGEVLRP